MPAWRVLITDFAWPDLEIECGILREIDAELVVAPSTAPDVLADLSRDVDAIMTCWAKVHSDVLQAATRCRMVARLGIGLDNIDVAWCTQHGVPVTNVPDYCLTEVAEHALALILTLGRKVAFYHQQTKAGDYQLQAGPPLRRLAGQTVGVVGLGNIGRCVARKASALGFHVVATSRRMPADAGAELVSFESLLERSDFVSLHLPLTPETRHMIGAAEFTRMKSTAYLINTARGGLVDHEALAAALANGQIAGAALDVQDPEPPPLDRPPYNDPRVIVTPHAAFVSRESLIELRQRAARQVVACLSGAIPENIVNPNYVARR